MRFSTIVSASLAPVLAAVASPTLAQFTYQGQLLLDGAPFDGAITLELSVFDVETAGRALATRVVETTADGGLVVFDPGLPASEFATADPRYLQITVVDDAGSLTLSPRQLVTPTPTSTFSLDANVDLQDAYDRLTVPRSVRLFGVKQDGGLTIEGSGGGSFSVFEPFGLAGLPRVVLEGGDERITFRTDGPADLRAELPEGSVSPEETAGEAGYALTTLAGLPSVSTTRQTFAAVELDAPMDGFAIVTATGQFTVNPTSNLPALVGIEFGLEDGMQQDLPGSPNVTAAVAGLLFGTNFVSIAEIKPISTYTVVPVTAGMNTFGLYAFVGFGEDSSSTSLSNVNLSAVFVPTSYGSSARGEAAGQPASPGELTQLRQQVDELNRAIQQLELQRSRDLRR